MNNEIKKYLEKFSLDIQELFLKLYDIVLNSTTQELNEKLWAGLPSFYQNDNSNHCVRLIAFNDHINIEASALKDYEEQLTTYTLTPKKMLKIKVNQEIPVTILKEVFFKTLEGKDKNEIS